MIISRELKIIPFTTNTMFIDGTAYDTSSITHNVNFTISDLSDATSGDTVSIEIGTRTYLFEADTNDVFDSSTPTVSGGDNVADPNLTFNIDKTGSSVSIVNNVEAFQVTSYSSNIASRTGDTTVTVIEPINSIQEEDEGITITTIPTNGFRITDMGLQYELITLKNISDTDSIISEMRDKTVDSIDNIKNTFSVSAPDITVYGIVVYATVDPNTFKPYGKLSLAYNLSSD